VPFYDIVIVGGGVAGGEVAVNLARYFGGKRRIALVSRDPVVYSKMTLSYGLKLGVKSIEPYVLYRPEELRGLGVDFLNDTVKLVDRSSRIVLTDGGQKVEYDTLILASGSKPRFPVGVEGLNLKGVYTFLSFEDMAGIDAVAERGRKALIVGAGMIGMLVADALLRRGVKVYLIDILPYPGLTAVEEELGKVILKRALTLGAEFYGATTLERLEGNGRVERALLSNGKRLDVDFVVVSIGVEPNIPGGLEGLERDPSGGIKTDKQFKTTDPSIYAIGDCASTIDIITGKLTYRPLGILASYAAKLIPQVLEGHHYNGFLAYQVEEAFGAFFMRAGLNGAELRRLGVSFSKALVEYRVPGVGITKSLVVVEKGTDRILGWQSVGSTLASYKSKVFEEAIRNGWSLSMLEEKGFKVIERTSL